MMRIITGKAKGIKLATLEGEATRPTAERVKEALFSMIQFELEGREVLDLFSGSGQLALEALSRGAAHAVMIDRSKDAVRIIRANAQKTRLEDACEIYNCEYRDYILKNKGKKFDIVFLDPPYALGLYDKAIGEMLRADMLKPSTLIVCESEDGNIFGKDVELSSSFEILRESRYGRACLTLLSLKRGNADA